MKSGFNFYMKPEDRLQASCVEFLNVAARPALLYYSIPNGANKGKVAAYIFKLTGLRAGASDFCITDPTETGRSGLYIEFKIRPNKPTKEQIEFLKGVHERGYATEICYTKADFLAAMLKYYPSNFRHVKF